MPDTPVTIRRAEKRDLPALGRLGAMLVRGHHAFDPARFLAPMPGVETIPVVVPIRKVRVRLLTRESVAQTSPPR